jgi:hypothetical protein
LIYYDLNTANHSTVKSYCEEKSLWNS